MIDVFVEEDVNKMVDKFAKESAEKLKDILCDKFYADVNNYLYEHYSNNKEKIENDLIRSITEEYIKDPKQYKFSSLREKMFKENKEEIVKTLSDEAIQKSVEDVIEKYTHRDYHFEWRWKDGIAKFILDNFEKFKDDKRVDDWIGRELESKENRIKWLEEKLREVSDVLDN